MCIRREWNAIDAYFYITLVRNRSLKISRNFHIHLCKHLTVYDKHLYNRVQEMLLYIQSLN